MMLDDVLTEHGLTGFTDTDRAELVSAWHRLSPWPDNRDGLSRLRETHITATLSNGSTALLIHLARAGGLTFDAILSAELIHSYKPTPDCAPHTFHARWNGASAIRPHRRRTGSTSPPPTSPTWPDDWLHSSGFDAARASQTHAGKEDGLRRSCSAGPGRAPRPGRSEPT
ncbi:hypothetical protein ACFW93_36295 [Streptomyces canus]|uniref:hypothetical protein n=1 Tax=Streptomyces canus TaxID=58343 RepID=UPI0036B932A7